MTNPPSTPPPSLKRTSQPNQAQAKRQRLEETSPTHSMTEPLFPNPFEDNTSTHAGGGRTSQHNPPTPHVPNNPGMNIDYPPNNGGTNRISNPKGNRNAHPNNGSTNTDNGNSGEAGSNHPTDIVSTTETSITLRSGFKCTKPPPVGFHKIQLGQTVTKFIEVKTAEALQALPREKVWARIWRARYTENLAEQITYLKTMLSASLGIALETTHDIVAIPATENGLPIPNDKDGGPIHFLVHSLSQKQALFLTNMEVIAADGKAIFIVPFHQPIPTYIVTINNLHLPPRETSCKMVKAVVVKNILENAEAVKQLTSAIEGIAPDRVAKFLESIKTSFLESIDAKNNPITLWNIYADGLKEIDSFSKYLEIARTFRSLPKYESLVYGTGKPKTARNQTACPKCKSMDHTSKTCPFDNIPGWLGPKENEDQGASLLDMDETIEPEPTTNSPIPRGRGRGRGQGRGGFRRGRGGQRGRGSNNTYRT